MSDLRVPMDAIMAAFGVPVTLRWPPPELTVVDTVGVWVPEFTQDAPVGGPHARREPRRVLALRRDEVPTVPQKIYVLAPDVEGGPAKGWRVDALEHSDAEHHRVLVVRDDAALILA